MTPLNHEVMNTFIVRDKMFCEVCNKDTKPSLWLEMSRLPKLPITEADFLEADYLEVDYST